jgi:hypothetical protein
MRLAVFPARRNAMSRCTLRNIFTVLIYAGVGVFLYPYITGRLSSGIFFLVAGIGLAVLSSILRCACIEGDCSDRIPSDPSRNTAQSSRHHPTGR